MSQSNHPGISPALVETIAGLSAGSVATLVVHPLDIVKTRMQIHRSPTSGPQPALTTMALIRSLTQNNQPLAALYRGLTPNLIGNASSWASFFFFKARVESSLAYYKAGTTAIADPKEVLQGHDFFLSSALAGAMTQVLTNPIWVIKTRMLSSDRAAEGAYPNILAGARKIYSTEGWQGFYRGLGVSLLTVAHGSVQFAVYEPAKKVYFRSRQLAAEKLSGEGQQPIDPTRMTNEATIVISSLAKLVAGAVTYPLQVFRSRLQNYNADERFGRGIRGVVIQLWREEGIRGFYRGLVPGVVRVMPATWVTFLVYENVKYHLPLWAA